MAVIKNLPIRKIQVRADSFTGADNFDPVVMNDHYSADNFDLGGESFAGRIIFYTTNALSILIMFLIVAALIKYLKSK